MNSPKSNKDVKKSEIFPGIFVEKIKISESDILFWLLEVDVKVFQVVDFTVDFSGSNNITIENSPDSNSLIIKTTIEPFSRKTIAKLILGEKFNVKTKIKFINILPSLSIQKEHMTALNLKLDQQISQFINNFDEKVYFYEESLLIQNLQSINMNFIDIHFLPNNFSIAKLSEEEIINIFGCMIHWRRGDDIISDRLEKINQIKEMPILLKNPSPENIKMGRLNSHGVLSAIAAISEKPVLINRLFTSNLKALHGFIQVKLCKLGKWTPVLLDDYFPCFPLGELMFSKTNENDFWLPFLEKAFAKLNQSYVEIIHLSLADALIDLTGCPLKKISLNPKLNNNEQSAEKIWNQLKKYKKLDFTLTAECKIKNVENDNIHTMDGFSYAITNLIEIDQNINKFLTRKTNEMIKIVEFRNLWELLNWNGELEKNNIEWEKFASKMNIDIKQEKSKKSWIMFEEFLNIFDVINICKTIPWFELRLRGKFITGVDSNDNKLTHFSSRWYYKFKITEPTEATFGLHQENDQTLTQKCINPKVDIGLVIMRFNNQKLEIIKHIDPKFDRQVFLKVSLFPGEYIVFPRSNGVNLIEKRINKKENDFSSKNKKIKKVIEEIFNKYDVLMKEEIGFEEISSVFKIFGEELNFEAYEKLIQKINHKNNDLNKNVDLIDFQKLFFDKLAKNTIDQNIDVLNRFGYKDDLFSFQSRLFTLSIHSDKLLKVHVSDAFEDNFDLEFLNVLLEQFGVEVNQNVFSNEQVLLVYYQNRFF